VGLVGVSGDVSHSSLSGGGWRGGYVSGLENMETVTYSAVNSRANSIL
jgi:hypothetical protein